MITLDQLIEIRYLAVRPIWLKSVGKLMTEELSNSLQNEFNVLVKKINPELHGACCFSFGNNGAIFVVRIGAVDIRIEEYTGQHIRVS